MGSDVTKRFALIKTVFLMVTWVAFGMIKEITGPTLQDLKLRMDTTYESIASTISCRSVGNFVGSVIGGLLIDRLGRYCDLMNALWFILIAGITVVIPWTLQIQILMILFMVSGIASAAINTGVEKTLLQLWKEKSASPMHVLHFGYGIGAFISPLIAIPFLGVFETCLYINSLQQDSDNLTAENHTYCEKLLPPMQNISAPSVDIESFDNTTLLPIVNSTSSIYGKIFVGSNVEYAFFLVAIPGFVIASIFLLYQRCFFRETDIKVDLKKRKGNYKLLQLFHPATCADGNATYGLVSYILIFLSFFNCAGAQRFYSNFIKAYSTEALGFSKISGSFVNSLFWIAFSIGRGSGAFTGRCLSIRTLVLVESLGLMIGALILNVFYFLSPVYSCWIATFFMGFSIGPLYPSGIAFADYHVNLTGIGLMVVNFGAGAGSLVCTWMTGKLFDVYGSHAFRYVALGIACSNVIVSLLQILLGRKYGSRFKPDSENRKIEKAASTNLMKNDEQTEGESGL